MFEWSVELWWRAGTTAVVTVRAWTLRGALNKGQRVGEVLMPKADTPNAQIAR